MAVKETRWLTLRRWQRSGFLGMQVLVFLMTQVQAVLALPHYAGGRRHQVEGLRHGTNRSIKVKGTRALVEWLSFSVEAGERFVIQGDQRQTLLNLVTGTDPSRIAGQVESGARFILANPNGISVLGSGSIVAPSVLFTTALIDPNDWLNREGVFSQPGDPWLSIPARPDHAVNLSGTIQARDGDRGGAIRIHADRIQVQGATLLANGPAGGGVIEIGTARAARQGDVGIASSVLIDASTRLQASATAAGHGGQTLIGARSRNGSVTVAGELINDGASTAGAGGRIQVSAERVWLPSGARLQANGPAAGGSVFVGGSWRNQDAQVPQALQTRIDQGASLVANATVEGTGGTVVAWSDVANPQSFTTARGLFSAQGGPLGGDGGRIETSGYRLDTAGASGGAWAPQGAAGVWLFDPYNIVVRDLSGDWINNSGPPLFTPTGNDSVVDAGLIETQLNNGTNVVLDTHGDGLGSQAGNITIASAITKTDGPDDVSLVLQAANDIVIRQPIDQVGGVGADGRLNLVLRADFDQGVRDGKGDVLINAPLGAVGSLGDVDVSGQTIRFSADSITTLGRQDFQGSSLLNADLTLRSVGNAAIRLGDVDGAHALRIDNGSGAITLGVVGKSQPLQSLLLDGTGANILNGNITATGDVDLLGTARFRESGTPTFDVGGRLICDIGGDCVPTVAPTTTPPTVAPTTSPPTVAPTTTPPTVAPTTTPPTVAPTTTPPTVAPTTTPPTVAPTQVPVTPSFSLEQATEASAAIDALRQNAAGAINPTPILLTAVERSDGSYRAALVEQADQSDPPWSFSSPLSNFQAVSTTLADPLCRNPAGQLKACKLSNPNCLRGRSKWYCLPVDVTETPKTSPPTVAPTESPTQEPTKAPTPTPVKQRVPTARPTLSPQRVPMKVPTLSPQRVPTARPTPVKQEVPTKVPTPTPVKQRVPTARPTLSPQRVPVRLSTEAPTQGLVITIGQPGQRGASRSRPTRSTPPAAPTPAAPLRPLEPRFNPQSARFEYRLPSGRVLQYTTPDIPQIPVFVLDNGVVIPLKKPRVIRGLY